MDNLWFQKIVITQIQYINVQQILVVTFEFTGAARSFMIMSCAARGVRKVGQHWTKWWCSFVDLSPDYRRIVNATHLTFVNLTAADTKVVQCLAENNHGFLLANAYVVVRGKFCRISLLMMQPAEVFSSQLLICSGASSTCKAWCINASWSTWGEVKKRKLSRKT